MIQIHPFDVNTAPEEVRKGLYRVVSAIELEEFPDDEPSPYEYRASRWRQMSAPHEMVERYYAEDDGEVSAYLVISWWPEDDPTNSYAGIQVHPDHRRKGIARDLTSHAVERLTEEGVDKLIVDAVDGVPWEEALERWGFRKSISDKRSRLYLADVDWDLMDAWIDRAAERASDYELVHFQGTVPDEYLEAWARVKKVMNTAPLEDLELADFDMTPEKWREEEKGIVARGDTYLAIGALHRPSGEFGGFTDIFVNELHMEQAYQHDTGVDPAHRNRGLGRWIKAEMAKRLARDFPGVNRIDTWNAGSNAAMLGINVEMGFKPVLLSNGWQGPFSEIRKHLA